METVVFIANDSVNVRREKVDGRSYIIAPATILREGVFKGTKGPVLYRSEMMSEKPAVWDGMPIVNNHPKSGKDYISASSPGVLDDHGMGVLKNTAWKERLTTEMWFDEEKTKKINPTVIFNLNSGKPFNVSTAMIEAEISEGQGEWNGTQYIGEVKSYVPDHLAVLTNSLGACSVEQGCGVLVNEMSYDRTRRAISLALELSKGYAYYVRDVYDSYFIYQDGNGDTFKCPYTENGDKVIIGDKPVPVKWVTEWRTMDGIFVGNCRCSKLEETKGATMNKQQQIDALIANGLYAETDRSWLTQTPDAGVAAMFAKIPAGNNPLVPAVANVAAVVQPVQAGMTITPEMADVLNEAVAHRETVKKSMIANILANPVGKSKFTDAYLNTLPLGTLQGMAEMAAANSTRQTAVANAAAPPLFTGQATTVVVANDDDEAPPHLVAPGFGQSKKKAAAAAK